LQQQSKHINFTRNITYQLIFSNFYFYNISKHITYKFTTTMVKKLLVLIAIIIANFTVASAQHKHGRTCASPSYEEQWSKASSEERARMEAIERFTQNYVERVTNKKSNGTQTKVTGVITIPVVVHVVYNTAAQNISDAIVQSQIDVLNADFRRTNADRTNTPSAFAGVASDFEIQFALATRDPQGNATNGIVRKSTTKTYFEYGGSDSQGVHVKQSSQGGSDAWDTRSYLNMWVCNFGGTSSSLLGYATFPTDAGTFKDGVVMGYKYFGVNPSLGGVFGYGRTATHEVGHWLNLRHIWGDANCGNDFVADTPTQQTSNGGCPTFPKVSCSNGANGDMFMNYMDYTNDQCMNMFTAGQKARARALFDVGGARVSLLSSNGLGSGTTPTCAVPTGLTSSSVTTSSATLAWAAVSGASSYSVRYKATSSTTWTTATASATSLNVTGLTAATTYEFQVSTVCSSTSSAFSGSTTFTTTSGSTTPTYCASKGNSVADEWIQTVRLARGTTQIFSNNSGKNAGYGNFTATSYTVSRGSSLTITITPGWTSTKYSEGYSVWVDYNRDGDFLDAGEQLFTQAATTTTPISRTFTVPTTATTGTTRMRVSMKYNGVPTSCETFGYGEVEDYTLNISATAARTEEATANTANVELYPNPASVEATLRVSVDTEQATDLAITLYNVQGQKFQTDEIKGVQGSVEHKLNLSGLKAGLYFVSIQYNDRKEVRKLIVTE
jgi:hypothetical protein